MEQVDYLRGHRPFVVKYVDPEGHEHDAIVTAVWSEDDQGPACINVVYVVDDKARQDSYGRQIERATSVQRKSEVTAHGRFFIL